MLGEYVLYYLLWKTKHPCYFLSYLAHQWPACCIKGHSLVEERKPGPWVVELSTGHTLPTEEFIHCGLVGTIKEQSGVLRLQ